MLVLLVQHSFIVGHWGEQACLKMRNPIDPIGHNKLLRSSLRRWFERFARLIKNNITYFLHLRYNLWQTFYLYSLTGCVRIKGWIFTYKFSILIALKVTDNGALTLTLSVNSFWGRCTRLVLSKEHRLVAIWTAVGVRIINTFAKIIASRGFVEFSTCVVRRANFHTRRMTADGVGDHVC